MVKGVNTNNLIQEIFLERMRGGNKYFDKKEGIKGRAVRLEGQIETGRGIKDNDCNN